MRNALRAIALGLELGMDPSGIAKGLARFKAPPMRWQEVQLRGIHFINDAYNANPLSMRSSLRTFAQLPGDRLDAARIDGAGEWRIFFQIVLPLSKPVLATIGLFLILRYWNDWFLALLFVDKHALYPLQYLLYVLMTNINVLASNPQTVGVPIPVQSARMAMAVLAFGPALFSFLLLQKYFVRGITIGGLKG